MGSLGFCLLGGTRIPDFPTVYSPVRTLAKYMYFIPEEFGGEKVDLAEYEA